MLKKLLIFILVATALFFAYRLARAKGWLRGATFDNLDRQAGRLTAQLTARGNFDQREIDKLGTDGMAQVKILATKAKEAGGVAQSFVEQVVKVDNNKDKNISEKAFEYGRYVYCQEVVKQYEVDQGINSAVRR